MPFLPPGLRQIYVDSGLLLVYYCFPIKKYRSLYLVSSLSLFLGDASGECLGEVVLFRRRTALYFPPENVS